MKKFTTKKTILAASIVLIAGIIATQAFAHMGGGYGGGYGMMNGNHMGYDSQMGSNMMGYGMTNLSVEDQQKMQDQMNTFFAATKGLREQRYQKQLELNQEYAKPEKDQAKIATLQKELFDLSSQFEKQRFDHMTNMQKLFADKDAGSFMGMGNGYAGCF